MPVGDAFRPSESPEARQFRHDRESQFEAAMRYHEERREQGLTVIKHVRAVSVCNRCSFERPYRDGDEDRPCPACQGGKGKAWTSGS